MIRRGNSTYLEARRDGPHPGNGVQHVVVQGAVQAHCRDARAALCPPGLSLNLHGE